MLYKDLVHVYTKVDTTAKRLDKTSLIAELLRMTPREDLEVTMLLLQGRIFQEHEEKNIGVASRLVLKAISVAAGNTANEIEREWKNKGDLGIVVESLMKKKKQATLFSHDLTVRKVFANLRKLAELEGPGTVDMKIKLIAELLSSATGGEARYIVRTVLGDLRVGIGEGSLRDAIVWAYFGEEIGLKFSDGSLNISDEVRNKYNEYLSIVQEAIDITNDLGEVAVLAKMEGIRGIREVKLRPCKPIKVMLYQKASSVDDAFSKVGKPAAFEYKYDGFRLNLHRKGESFRLFTRRLEDVTRQFPDVIALLKKHIIADNYILDAEVIGTDPITGKWLAFQHVSQRIRRKYGIPEMAKKVPVMVNLFDAIAVNGESLLKTAFNDRRKRLSAIVKPMKGRIVLAEQLVTDDKKKAQQFYEKALKLGNEGIMAKALEAPYKPGSRVGYGVKLKPTMENLDLAIVGAEWGEGKRANWLSSFTLACYDPHSDMFLEIGRVGTGIKEKKEEGISFEQLTELAKPLISAEKGRGASIRPKIVVEVAYEEIQKSPTYSSGFALRFPRLVSLREDKAPEDASTIDMVEELFYGQK